MQKPKRGPKPNPEGRGVVTSVTIPPRLFAQMKKAAEVKGMSFSAFMVVAGVCYLEQEGAAR